MRHSLNMQRRLYLVALFALTLSGSAADWPGWRGPDRNGQAVSRGVFKQDYRLEIAWFRPLGSGYSSVSVAEGIAVTMAAVKGHDVLIALDTASGETLWSLRLEPVFKGRDGSDDGPLSTPVIHRGRVFALSPEGRLVAVALKTGRLLWEHHLVKEYGGVMPDYGYASSPLVHDDLLILQSGGLKGDAVMAFDSRTGACKWVWPGGTVHYQSPTLAVIDGKPQFIFLGWELSAGLNPLTGEELWRLRHMGKHTQGTPTDLGGNRVLLPFADKEIMLLGIESGPEGAGFAPVWRGPVLGKSFHIALYREGFLYGFWGKLLTCVDAATGTRLWMTRSPDESMIMFVDDRLVLFTEDGRIIVSRVSAEGFNPEKEIRIFKTRTFSAPAFVDDTFYVRSLKSAAAIRVTPMPDK
ncbi:MAG: PQQ-binding-like beta-propeller repeat protein [Acidobacteriota bacterium]|nr:PQQ-binding-like beta-propeller repeat protein [Acidobacteriota bacterium]